MDSFRVDHLDSFSVTMLLACDDEVIAITDLAVVIKSVIMSYHILVCGAVSDTHVIHVVV